MGSETGRNSIQLASHLASKRHCGFTYSDWLRACPRTTIAWVLLPFPVPPLVITDPTWYRNINLFSIDYAFRPRLRSRLTLSRRTLLRKPRTISGGDSHPSFVTYAGILTSQHRTKAYANAYTLRTLSYRVQNPQACTPVVSVTSFSPVTLSAPEHLTSELLRTLSRVAASKPTSWLSVHSDIVYHLASTLGP